MIRVSNINKQYGKKEVLHDISLDINQGELTCLIGSNGAGKSTLLSIMSRLLKQDSGHVEIDGVNIEDYASNPLAKKISVLKQSQHIQVKLTVRELVSFGRFPHSQGRLSKTDEEKVSQAIHYLQLDDIEHRYIDELSGGQRQRAYIAMVVAQDSDYIFLDEPLNNLDMKHANHIMQILKKLVKELNKGIIVVIHDINFASIYADKIIGFKDGHLAYQGSSLEMMQELILSDLFDMDMAIHEIEKKKICFYY